MGEIVLFVDNFNEISFCRICHEAEFESCSPLEAPCACSGTSKFAHRECIQKWCDEKGDTVCEICLQKFKPGYTAIPKKPKKIIIVQDQDEAISNIRENLEIPATREEFENSEMRAIAECSSAADKNVSCCKTLLLIFTGLLLMRHLFDVLVSGGARHYHFSLVTVLCLRASGIIIPMYIIIRIVTALRSSIKQDQNLYNTLIHNTNNREDDEQEQLHDRDNLDSL